MNYLRLTADTEREIFLLAELHEREGWQVVNFQERMREPFFLAFLRKVK